MKLTKTNMEVCVAKQDGYDVYRVVFKSGDHYVIKWCGYLVNVDEDVKNRNYRYRNIK